MEIAATAISALLAVTFVAAGGTKLLGMRTHVESFQQWGYPPWFRVAIGVVELGAAAALLVGLWVDWLSVAAGLVIGGVMLGAVYTHIRASEVSQLVAPVILGALAAVVIGLKVALAAG